VAAVQAEAGLALARLTEQPASQTAAAWPAAWALALQRLQPLRWLILGLSLAGAARLAIRPGTLIPLPVLRRMSGR
jgi:hypothetical protein